MSRLTHKTTNTLGQTGRCSFGVLYRVGESECKLQLTPEGQKKLRSKVNILTFGQLTVDAQLNLVIMTTSPRTRKTGVSLPLKEQTLK